MKRSKFLPVFAVVLCVPGVVARALHFLNGFDSRNGLPVTGNAWVWSCAVSVSYTHLHSSQFLLRHIIAPFFSILQCVFSPELLGIRVKVWSFSDKASPLSLRFFNTSPFCPVMRTRFPRRGVPPHRRQKKTPLRMERGLTFAFK